MVGVAGMCTKVITGLPLMYISIEKSNLRHETPLYPTMPFYASLIYN